MSGPLERDLAEWLDYLRALGVRELRVPELPVPELRRATARPPAVPPRAAPAPAPAEAPSRSRSGQTSLGLGEQFPDPPVEDPAARLAEIRDDLGDCTRCKLHGGRTNLVFGVGNPRARLMFVGEGPGAEEDARGEPFVGRAGKKLDEMIAAIGLRREDVYIANVVKCRPPGNRDPEPDEIATCSPFLIRQIEAVRPCVIVTLGSPATRTLLRTREGITHLRGTWQTFRGIPVMPTYHPAYLLRSYTLENRRKVFEDLKAARERMEDPGA
jgi:uracil-DNA glycosylase